MRYPRVMLALGVALALAAAVCGPAMAQPGTVWTWGYNFEGELGIGTGGDEYLYSPLPVQPPDITSAIAVDAGDYHCIVLKSDGTVWTWGDNEWGQLGDGSNYGSWWPIQVPGLSDIVAVAAGHRFNLVLTAAGTVWGWGENWGQLGDNTIEDRVAPVQVHGPNNVGFLTNAVAIYAGDQHSMAILTDGTLWGWGRNGQGRLGDGTTTHRLTPVQVVGLTDVVQVACGYDHTLAVRRDGTVWAWGGNSKGQLGDGTTTNRLTPIQVPGLTNVRAVSAGYWSSLALRADGTMLAWGYNFKGQLGNGSDADSLVPVVVSGLTNVVGISCGDYHGHAVRSDGTVWSWGWNDCGQLGDGTFDDRWTPVQVAGLAGISTVAAGYSHCIALAGEVSGNTPPVADGQNVTATTCVPKAITLTGSDADGDPLTFAIVSGPSHGSLSGTPPDVTYTSDDAHSGSDSFTFKVNDGEADSFPATVNIQILPAGTSLRTTDCAGIYGGNVQLRQYDLKRTTDGTALMGKTVAYKVDGTQVGTAVTDSGGNSTLNWGINAGPVSRTVTVEFAGDAAYGPSSAAGTLTVQPASPYIWVAPRSVNLGSPAGLYAYFRTVPGYVPQAGKTVTFRMDGTAVGTSVTDDGGVARYSYDTHGMSMGDHAVRCEFGGEALVSSGYGEGVLTILPARPYIWVAERTVNAGSMASLYAYFRTLPDKTPQAGKTLTFKIDGMAVGSKTTDSSGVARYPYDTHGMAMGSHTIRCEFGGDAEVASGYGEAPLTILGAQPYIWVAERTVNAGSMASLYAYFRTLPDLIPQAGKTVKFKIDGTAVGNQITDSSGVARYSYDTHGLSIGNHTIRCEFSGDAEVAAGYGEAPLTVLPARPYIWVADRTVKAGSMTDLYAYFRTLPDLVPQPGKMLKFKLDGSLVRTVVTDSSGVARYGFDTHGRTPGVHTIRCEFAGDAEVAAGYGDGTLTIN